MKLSLLLVLWALAMPAAAQDFPPPKPVDPPVITDQTPVYTQADVPPNYEHHYPSRAYGEGIDGTVDVKCQAGDDGRMTRCVVLDEHPPKFGFGEATAFLFLKYALMKPGTFTSGNWYAFEYRWRAD